MEQLVQGYWQQWGVLKVVIIGIVLFILIRIVYRLLKILAVRYKNDFGYKKYFPLVEMIIWLSFIYWSLDQIFNDPLYFSIFFITISVMGLIWVGWYGLRDYIAGIILRIQDVYDKGHQLSTGGISGKILKLGHLNLELEKEDGSVIKIPYSEVAGKIHLNKNVDKIIVTEKINLKIPKNYILADEIENLRKYILNSPWHVSYIDPQVRQMEEESDFYNIELILFTPGPDSFDKLQLGIQNKYQQKT
jgi:hypothetical protein